MALVTSFEENDMKSFLWSEIIVVHQGFLQPDAPGINIFVSMFLV